MNLTIHRGSHEIGGSCVEIASREGRIIIDIGMPLVRPDGTRFNSREHKQKTWQALVQEKILPDNPGMYDGDTHPTPIDGLLISHAHADHHGFLKFVRKDINCYMGAGTKELLDIGDIFVGQGNNMGNRPHTLFKKRGSFPVGAFTVTPFLMDHSAFDAYAFLIECGGKRIIYSGDFRDHGRKLGALGRFLRSVPKGVDALLLEGTQVGREDKQSLLKTENDIAGEMKKVIGESKGPVLCAVSGQNIDRLVSVYKAAVHTKRTLLIDLYTATVLDALNGQAKIPSPTGGYSNLAVYCPPDQYEKLKNSDRKNLLDRMYKWKWEKVIDNLSRSVLLVRKFAVDKLNQHDNLEGATLIYSMWGGYLKDDSSNKLRELVEQKKMKVAQIHTSGHADLATLRKVVDSINPKAIIPIHTFDAKKYPDIFSDRRIIMAQDGVEIAL